MTASSESAMPPVRVLDLGELSPLRSQTVYHAAAYAMTPTSPDTIILVSSGRPYVCVGYHQDVYQEVDLGYCREVGLPIYRREVGGGAVYLDRDQLFVQWVFRRGRLPALVEERFELYVRPLVETYRTLGIPAYYRPVNDIHVAGKKIGGTGAAWIGEADVVVGSLMFAFDKRAMARVIKVSSEKMRDKVVESLDRYMTTITEELGRPPDRAKVKSLYLEKCAAALGRELYAGSWTGLEEARARDIDERLESDEWLYQRSPLRQSGVKIHQDVRVVEGTHKAPGGLIRATVRLQGDLIDDVALSGDFTLLPPAALSSLEAAARGGGASRPELSLRLAETYLSLNVVSPGVTPDDFAAAVASAAGLQP